MILQKTNQKKKKFKFLSPLLISLICLIIIFYPLYKIIDIYQFQIFGKRIDGEVVEVIKVGEGSQRVYYKFLLDTETFYDNFYIYSRDLGEIVKNKYLSEFYTVGEPIDILVLERNHRAYLERKLYYKYYYILPILFGLFIGSDSFYGFLKKLNEK